MNRYAIIVPSAFTYRLLSIFLILLIWRSDSMGQDLLGDSIGFSGATMHLREYVDIGAGSLLISITTLPANTGYRDLFVSLQSGVVYAVSDDGFGNGIATQWFNYDDAVNAAVTNASDGFVLDSPGSTHGGLRAIAFHPDFAVNGKFYTSAIVDRPNDGSGLHYLGTSTSGFDAESVVAEWTYDYVTDQVVATSYRELFRVQMPVFDHPIKQIAFNNHAKPGDEDYGLLYIAHGDGSEHTAVAGGGHVADNALGKILRINPLQSGNDPYTTPGNPYVGTPGMLDEIYTLGHRNPHNISFAKNTNGNTHVIVAEAGRDNIEEINVLVSGGDFGWSSREGTFVHNNTGGPNGSGYGLDYGVSNLPTNDWELNDYFYPAAQYDHDSSLGDGYVGSAVAGGYTIDNYSDPSLQNVYIFTDFGQKSGYVYQTGLTDLLNAHTQLVDYEDPSALTQAPITHPTLTLDSDGDGVVDVSADNLNTLLGVYRSDARFGRGVYGEMYISSKATGKVYLVTNSIPTYSSWSTASIVSSQDRGFTDDADGDGTPNGWEYVFGDDFVPVAGYGMVISAPPKIVPADVTLELEFTTDLTTSWTTVIRWINGEATLMDSDFTYANGLIMDMNPTAIGFFNYKLTH